MPVADVGGEPDRPGPTICPAPCLFQVADQAVFFLFEAKVLVAVVEIVGAAARIQNKENCHQFSEVRKLLLRPAATGQQADGPGVPGQATGQRMGHGAGYHAGHGDEGGEELTASPPRAEQKALAV